MEIQHQSAQARGDVLKADLTRSNRKGIERALEGVPEPKGDRVELSEASRNLTKDLETATEESAEHRQRVAELMEQYQAGTLNSRERIERAAGGILGGNR